MNLRELRLLAGLRQRDVADVLSCAVNSVATAERGYITPTYDSRGRAVSRALAMGIETFLLDFLAGESSFERPTLNNFSSSQVRRWHRRPHTAFDAVAALYPLGIAHIVDELGQEAA